MSLAVVTQSPSEKPGWHANIKRSDLGDSHDIYRERKFS